MAAISHWIWAFARASAGKEMGEEGSLYVWEMEEGGGGKPRRINHNRPKWRAAPLPPFTPKRAPSWKRASRQKPYPIPSLLFSYPHPSNGNSSPPENPIHLLIALSLLGSWTPSSPSPLSKHKQFSKPIRPPFRFPPLVLLLSAIRRPSPSGAHLNIDRRGKWILFFILFDYCQTGNSISIFLIAILYFLNLSKNQRFGWLNKKKSFLPVLIQFVQLLQADSIKINKNSQVE